MLEQAQSIALAGIGDRARRRIQYAGITVDGAESRDLDDGIWAERLSDGGYAMWVHISDVSAFIEPGSAIDADIHDRTTSVYGPGGVLAMMPHILSEQHLSLHPGSPKLAMTARIELAHDGRVRKFAFEDSVFTNIRRYHYENFAKDFLDPDSEHHDMLHLMREIADVRRAHRMSEGAAANYDESDRRLSLVPGHERIITAAKSLPHHIIAEFMIAANEAAATYCYEAGAISLYRRHETLRERAYYTERPGAHTGLGLRLYTHFTSPIRRLADVIVHRAIRAVAEGKPAPHSHADVVRAGHHANFMREAIESTQRQARLEDRWEGAIDRIKARKDTVEFPDLTPYIRAHCALPYSRLPENVAAEIIRGIEHGPKGHWAWSVSTLLSSSHAGVKAALRKAVMKRKRLSPRAVLRILADTR